MILTVIALTLFLAVAIVLRTNFKHKMLIAYILLGALSALSIYVLYNNIILIISKV